MCVCECGAGGVKFSTFESTANVFSTTTTTIIYIVTIVVSHFILFSKVVGLLPNVTMTSMVARGFLLFLLISVLGGKVTLFHKLQPPASFGAQTMTLIKTDLRHWTNTYIAKVLFDIIVL